MSLFSFFVSAVYLLFPEKAVQVALNETSEEDTLMVLTGDHSHGITINGYPKRGQNILGASLKKNKHHVFYKKYLLQYISK